MAKGYHVLAGVCRDLGNALRDDADGSQEAEKLLDAFDEVLELLYDRSDREVSLGQEGDEPGVGDDSDDEDSPVGDLRRKVATVPGVGKRGEGPTLHSTRARARVERMPSRPEGALCGSSPREVRAVPAPAGAARPKRGR